MTVVLVNRSTTETKATTLNFSNFIVQSTSAEALRLSSLPTTETFVSHNQNAISRSNVNFTNNTTSVSLPPLSITSLTFKGKVGRVATLEFKAADIKIYPNPFVDVFTIDLLEGGFTSLSVYNTLGQQVFTQKINASDKLLGIKNTFPAGVYFVELISEKGKVIKEITALNR
jgi:Secretion system C-terminal sorting domain